VIKERALACYGQGHHYPGLAEKLSWANILKSGMAEGGPTNTVQRLTEPLYNELQYERLVSRVTFKLSCVRFCVPVVSAIVQCHCRNVVCQLCHKQ
jgi:hypothetical protein